MLVNFEKALEIISYTIEKYNCMRPHSSCDYLTPQQAHFQSGQIRKRWKKATQVQGKVQNEVLQ